MKVKLISYTKSALQEHTGCDDLLALIAYVARVSNPTNQLNNETSERLVKYLIKNRHWSPFEMVDITLEIQTTRDIAHQILRHRSFSFQEFSQRYAEATLGVEFSEARLQDHKNRQNSIETTDKELQDWWLFQQNNITETSYAIYTEALNRGIAKEVARKVLPEGLTTTRLYMKGSIRSWIHYLDVRTDPSTQKEHREVADACAQEIVKLFAPILPLLDKSAE